MAAAPAVPATVSESKAVKFDLDGAWDPSFVPLLKNPRVQAVTKLLSETILYGLLVNPDSITTGMSEAELAFFRSVQERVKECKTRVGRQAIVAQYGAGRFSNGKSYTGKDFTVDREGLLAGKYDDPLSLGYYRYSQHHDVLSVLMWTLCHLLWPTKTWVIATCEHPGSVVFCREEPGVHYTFYRDEIDQIYMDETFTNPVQFFAYRQLMTRLNLPITKETVVRETKREYGKLKDPMLVKNVIAYSGRDVLELQEAYQWALATAETYPATKQ